MTLTQPDPKEHQRHGRSPGCCLGSLLTVLVLGLGGYAALNVSPHVSIPTPAMPADNAYDEVIRAGVLAANLVHKSPLESTKRLSPQENAVAVALCAQEASPIVSMVQDSLQKAYMAPACRTFRSAIGNFGPKNLRRLSRVLCTCADNERQNGRTAESVAIRLDGIEMAVGAVRGEATDGLLTSLACESLFENGLEEQIRALNSQQLAHVSERMDRICARRIPFADVVLEEGYSQTAAFQDLMGRSGKSGLRSYSSIRALITPDEQKALSWSERRAITGYLLTGKETILKENLAYFTRTAEELRKPRSERNSVRFPGNLLANFEIGLLGVGLNAELQRESVFAILRTEAALARRRAVIGAYPERLAQLCPFFLSKPERDPFGARGTEQLHYTRLSNDRYLLYGIGPNRQDDGGVRPGSGIPQAGDIVSGFLSKPTS